MTTTNSPTVGAPDSCPARRGSDHQPTGPGVGAPDGPTVKATGHRVWCTDGRRPVGFRRPASECTECGPVR